MIWVWSLESSSQLFTQNLLTQRSWLARAHRGNKVRSGAGSVPALWLQSVCECVCACTRECIERFAWDVYVALTKPTPFIVRRLILLCSRADCFLCLLLQNPMHWYLFYRRHQCVFSSWRLNADAKRRVQGHKCWARQIATAFISVTTCHQPASWSLSFRPEN